MILNAQLKELKVVDMRSYLKMHGLDEKGRKEVLVDRILSFLEHKNSI